jgi:hypothetical protein
VVFAVGLGVRLVVLRRPLRGRFMWPFDVAGLAIRYLRTVCVSKFGAPLRNPALMALRRDDIGGLHRLWWANFTAFAFVVRAYENPAMYWCGARPIQGPGCGRAATVWGSYVMRLAATAGGSEMHALRLEAACSSTCGPFAGVPGVVHTCSGVNGRVHRSVDGSLCPRKITFLLYFTTHFSLSKVMVHPALHSTLIPNKDAIFIPGTICPVNTVGRPGILMSHVCVDNTFLSSGRLIVMGCAVSCTLSIGVPSITKIEVAPVSAIA